MLAFHEGMGLRDWSATNRYKNQAIHCCDSHRNDERTVSGNTTFLNGSLGVTTQTTNGATTSFIRDPDGKPISMRNSAGVGFYYTTDALGSVILLTDASQAKAATYSYDAWGNTTQSGAQAGNNPYQHVSGYKDAATGYTKFGARYYNPAIGRFTQLDPSGQDPHYSYAGNNPFSNTDQTDLSFWDEFTGSAAPELLGGVVGAFGGLASTSFTKTVPGALAGAGFGCAAGITDSVMGNDLSGEENTAGSIIGSRAGGAAAGLLGFSAGKLSSPNKLD
ncbi:RHS repeat-associated core domain-containing protein [Arthrobacter sp. NPDC097144]|uniref:RHS repeat-associated core domain-containing protein n=1 Tax=Arthrobacter sp. NPDC097144 TaxID=3363946 RepID=UPI0037F3D8B6